MSTYRTVASGAVAAALSSSAPTSDTLLARIATPIAAPDPARSFDRSPYGTFAWCPMCDGRLEPEHAHFRCPECGWRDSCCD